MHVRKRWAREKGQYIPIAQVKSQGGGGRLHGKKTSWKNRATGGIEESGKQEAAVVVVKEPE